MSNLRFIRRIINLFKISRKTFYKECISQIDLEPIVIENMSGYKLSVQNDQLFRLCPIYSCNARPSNGTVNLALQLYHSEKKISGFLHKLRNSIARKQDHFIYFYEDKTEREAIKAILPLLLDGYLTDANEIMSEKIFIRIALIPNVIWFLNGGYLELALAEIAEKILKAMSEKTGCSYRVYRNAIIKEAQRQNEFDLLIDVEENLRFAIEAKSGSNFRDYAKYTFLMTRYGIIPDYFLLTQSGLTDESVERIQDAVGYQVCSTDSFESRLRSILSNHISAQEQFTDLVVA